MDTAAVAEFIEYLTAQSRLNKGRALLLAWPMLVDIKDTANFLQNNNPTTCAQYLRYTVTGVVVDRNGKVLMACPFDTPDAILSDPMGSSLGEWATRFWRPHFTEWAPYITSHGNAVTGPPAIIVALRVLGLALHDRDLFLSKFGLPNRVEEARVLLRLGRSPSSQNDRYINWPGIRYENPVVGDFGIFKGPDPSTFHKLGNINSKLGGIDSSTRPLARFRREEPKMLRPGVYRYTLPAGSLQENRFRCPGWTKEMWWSCELVDKELEWDVFRRSVKRLANQHKVAPDKIALVTETWTSFPLPSPLSDVAVRTDAELYYTIHLDDHGHLSHQYWSYEDRVLNREEMPRHISTLASLRLPHLRNEDLDCDIKVMQCLKVKKRDLLLDK
ncbi:hypothetical protein FRB99_002234, partial [Tulasnella sp. 403]